MPSSKVTDIFINPARRLDELTSDLAWSQAVACTVGYTVTVPSVNSAGFSSASATYTSVTNNLKSALQTTQFDNNLHTATQQIDPSSALSSATSDSASFSSYNTSPVSSNDDVSGGNDNSYFGLSLTYLILASVALVVFVCSCGGSLFYCIRYRTSSEAAENRSQSPTLAPANSYVPSESESLPSATAEYAGYPPSEPVFAEVLPSGLDPTLLKAASAPPIPAPPYPPR